MADEIIQQPAVVDYKAKYEELLLKANAQGADGGQGAPDVDGLVRKRDELLAALKKEKDKREKLEAEKAEAERKSLESQSEYKTLYEKEKAAREAIAAEKQNLLRVNIMKDHALSAGVLPQYLQFIIPQMDKLEWNGENEPVNVQDYFTALQTSAPAFFGTEPKQEPAVYTTPKVDSGKTGLTGAQAKPFTPEMLSKMSLNDYMTHREEIRKQETAGLIH